ncbi:IclR family transcriptional regulator [Cupriavidus alkaliphilus]|uniref:IclR family transcriptional regulator n=1 Tax=Cupriavidus alkaliphilus TaxID=942866 RepID=UPI0016170195|nr:helix-turn-helix domain-containing protein [Cupriavidus alkaliphilus]MBB2919329.1 DNA-binding IclR family transcriptional regulator [Cupriavidus alkaliphilus]
MGKISDDTSSTRRLTRETGTFTRSTAGSQSLSRGLALLRTFLAGAPVLTNSQLSDRSGLPKPTVSRLTRSLVEAGFLEYERTSEGYRLSPVCLAFANAFRLSRTELNLVLPLMRKVAVEERVNVGLSTADELTMIYLDTLREGHGPLRRTVRPGVRLPMETSSPGHAYLAALHESARKPLMLELAKKCGRKWPRYQATIAESAAMLSNQGYCRSKASLGVEGIACAVTGPDGVIYALNLSFSAEDLNYEPLVAYFVPVLRGLASRIRQTWDEFALAESGTVRDRRS